MYMYHTLSKPATMEACQDFYSNATTHSNTALLYVTAELL